MPKQRMNTSKKFWVTNKIDQNTGEILIYGDICDYSWWDEDITPTGFIEDIDNLGEVDTINIRINSNGGSVFAAHAIANYLKSKATTKNVYIDGIAASAATIIAMAGDNVYMPSTAMMMIHNPSIVLWGGYNADDFEEMIAVLNKIKESIINAYVLKTGLDREEISELMSNETWLNGAEAVEKGFADFLEDEKDIDLELEETQNSKFLVVNNIKFDMNNFSNISKFNNLSVKKPNKIKNIKEDKNKMTLEEIKNQHPDLFNQIKNMGAEEERNRIKEIENISIPGFDDLVNKAKFETCQNAGQLSIEILKKQKDIGLETFKNLEEDAKNLDEIPAVGDINETDEQKVQNSANKIAKFYKNKKGDK